MTVHSSGKILVFKTIGILLPFLALVILELALRVFHYGDNVDLFVDYPADKQYLIFNPKASHKYFAGPGLATTGNQELFTKKKGVNVFRIFVLGESTTLGYPYFHNGSFHRWLQYRLMHTFPDTEFEVINLSLTAVNSWTVLGFAKELVDYSPDAVLIYSGHNEYYGALGVASTDNIAGNRLVIKSVLALRNLRFFQGITRLYARIRFSHSSQSGDTRMKSMVAEAMIPYGSELYNRGLTQFESNLKETLDVLNRHGVPVFVSTLVSNEKDFKPFVSGPEEGEPKKPDSDNAFNNYDLGQAAYAVGDFDDAKQYFSKARDLDGLRFRATGQVNQILSRLSNNYPNVKLVDAMAEFEAASPHHIIGDELMLEHVHPNLRGYGLLSDAFYRSIRPLFKLSRNAEEMTFQQLQRLMPITAVDSLA